MLSRKTAILVVCEVLALCSALAVVCDAVYAGPRPVPSSYYFDLEINDLIELGESNPGAFVDTFDLNEPDDVAVVRICVSDTMTGGTVTLEAVSTGTGSVLLCDINGSAITPLEWDLPEDSIPDCIYVRGLTASTSLRDITLTATYTNTQYSTDLTDSAALTVGMSRPTERAEGDYGDGAPVVTSPQGLRRTVDLVVEVTDTGFGDISSAEFEIYDDEDVLLLRCPARVISMDEEGVPFFSYDWVPIKDGTYRVVGTATNATSGVHVAVFQLVVVYAEDMVSVADTEAAPVLADARVGEASPIGLGHRYGAIFKAVLACVLLAGDETPVGPEGVSGLEVWLKPDESQVRTTASDALKRWYSSAEGSKTGSDVVQTRGPKRPEWIDWETFGSAGDQVMLPVVRFDGLNDVISKGIAQRKRYWANTTTFIVFKIPSSGMDDGDELFATRGAAVSGEKCYRIVKSGAYLAVRQGSVDYPIVAISSIADAYTILTCAIEGDTLRTYVNGKAVYVNASSELVEDDADAGRSLPASEDMKRVIRYVIGKKSPCDIAEVVFYRGADLTDDDMTDETVEFTEGAVSVDDRLAIERYLSRKYKISLDGNNARPVIDFENPGPNSSVREGETMTLKVTVSDPDNAAFDSPPSLYIDDEEVLVDRGSGPEKALEWNALADAYTYDVVWCVDTHTWGVGSHTVCAKIASDGGAPNLSGESETLEVIVHEAADNDASDDDEGWIPVFTSPEALCIAPESDGDFSVRLEVAVTTSDDQEITSVDFEVYWDGELLTTIPGLRSVESADRYWCDFHAGMSEPVRVRAVVTDSKGRVTEAVKDMIFVDVGHPAALPGMALWLEPIAANVFDAYDYKPYGEGYYARWKFITPTVDGQRITTWLNRAPGYDEALQARAGIFDWHFTPQWVKSHPQLGGRPAVKFGYDDYLLDDVKRPIYSANSMVFLVVKARNVRKGSLLRSGPADSKNARFFRIMNRDGRHVTAGPYGRPAGCDGVPLPTEEFVILTMEITDTKLRFFKNGAPWNGANADWLGAGHTIGQRHMKRYECYILGDRWKGMPCEIGEMLIYRGEKNDFSEPVMSESNRRSIEQYLSVKYGIGLEDLNQKPFVKMVSPKNGSKLMADGVAITLKAVAMDPNGTTAMAPLDGLEARWGCDERSGTSVSDSSGNGRDATVTGATQAVQASWDTGEYGGALGFAATTEAVSLPDSVVGLIDGSHARTITLRFKSPVGVDNSDKPILTLGTTNRLEVIGSASRVAVRVISSTGTHVYGVDSTQSSDQWHFLAIRYDGVGSTSDAFELFLDETELTSATNLDSTVPIQFSTDGAVGSIGGGGFAGTVDDVRIYSRALTVDEIESVRLHKSGREKLAFYVDGEFMDFGDYDAASNMYTCSWTPKAGVSRIKVAARDSGAPTMFAESAEIQVNGAIPDMAANDGDSDDDGIEDWWELAYFGTLEYDEEYDSDDDDLNLLAEFNGGYNPLIADDQDAAPSLVACFPKVGETIGLPAVGEVVTLVYRVDNTGGAAIIVKDQYGQEIKDRCQVFDNGIEMEVQLCRKVLRMDGIDPVPFGSAISSTGAFTVAMWAKIDGSVGADDVLLGGSSNDPSLSFDSTGKCQFVSGNGTPVVTSTETSEPGEWIHIGVTRAANGIVRMFRNGEQVAESTVAWAGNLQLGAIGAHDGGNALIGCIDDLRFYDGVALAAGDLTTIMQGLDPSSAATAHWRFDDDPDYSEVADCAGSNDLTLNGLTGVGFDVEDYISGQELRYTIVVDPDGAAIEIPVWVTLDLTPPTVRVVNEPGVSYPGGRYYNDVPVVLETEDTAEIVYSVDGTDPTAPYSQAITISRAAGQAKILKYKATDSAGNVSIVSTEVYFFSDVAAAVTGLEAEYMADDGQDEDRVVCTWDDLSATSYYVYRAVNAFDRRLLQEAYLGGYPPLAYLRVNSQATTGCTYADPTIATDSRVWYGVTALTGQVEGALSDLVPVDVEMTIDASDAAESVERAVQWLSSRQALAGGWRSSSWGTLQATAQAAEALRTSRAWAANHPLSFSKARMHLRGNFPVTSAGLSHAIYALQNWGENTEGPHLRLALRAHRDDTGKVLGWGATERDHEDALHTALAVRARKGSAATVPDASDSDDLEARLAGTGDSSDAPLCADTGTSTDRRYGWVPKRRENIYVSALAYDALEQNRTGETVGDWILSAQLLQCGECDGCLASEPCVDVGRGCFDGGVLATGAALLYTQCEGTTRESAEAYLLRQQSRDGGWQDDIYVTSLCLAALNRVVEIEDVANTISSPMTVDAESGISYVTSTASGTRVGDPVNDNDGVVLIPFEVTTDGTYKIAVRVKAVDATEDAFLVSVDSTDEWKEWVCGSQADWFWDTVSDSGVDCSFILARGKHVLRIAYKEPGGKLDRFLILSVTEQ